jgi:hypothetical protein
MFKSLKQKRALIGVLRFVIDLLVTRICLSLRDAVAPSLDIRISDFPVMGQLRAFRQTLFSRINKIDRIVQGR